MATAAQIRAEIAAGPQTQEALDAALLKYSPAEMAAAFPQFGDVNDYDTARKRLLGESPAFTVGQGATPDSTESRDPVNSSGLPVTQRAGEPGSPEARAAAYEKQMAELDARKAARAAAGEPNYNQFAITGFGPNGVTQYDTTDPMYTGPGTGIAGGTGTATTTGGGLLGTVGAPAQAITPVATTTPTAPTAPANTRIQAIQQWYNSNVGRTDPQAQGDLNRFLATSGYTAREINAALPQWGLNDLQNAMRTAIGEVAQQTPFAPVAAQPMRPLAQPYTSIASQLPGGADTRMQEIRNWYAANEGRGTQADLDRWLASGYTAQEINRALPQWGVADLDRAIATARQAYPQAEAQSGLAQYQNMAPGAQYAGSVSPYGLIMDQMQPFQNPYADSLANTALGGYNPGVYNVLLDETVDPKTGIAVPVNDGGTGGPGDDGPGPGDTSGTPGASGSTDADGGTSAGGCVDPNVMVLLADGSHVRAGDIRVGDMLHTIHEDTFVYGDFPVEFIQIIDQPKVEAEFDDGQKIIVSTTHKFLTAANEWKKIEDIAVGEAVRGLGDVTKTLKSVTSLGNGPVVKMTVTDAHTYIADGLVSHNKYNGGLVTAIFGPDPAGPDEGQIDIQRGEYVIKKSSVKKYGAGLLDMINEGKIPAKKMKSLLG
jgi:hypothetical protein